MTGEFILVSVILIAGFGLLAFLVMRSQKRDGGSESLMLLQNQLSELRQTLDSRLGESSKAIQSQFGESVRIIRDVSERLTKVDEAARQAMDFNKQAMDFNKGFSEQLRGLQDVLKNPKQRGILGEYFLETVLKNVLPPNSYQMQYEFSDGVKVDAVVFYDNRIIPVDSKFSLENYIRILEATNEIDKKRFENALIADLKIRIDETSKYVKPQEDTMDFAFMFIPSETLYYDLLVSRVGSTAVDKNLIAYAGQKHVIIVSPTSFLAYLQTVIQGLRNQKISEQAKEIIKQVENLSRHLRTHDDNLQKLGKSLGTSVSSYNNAYKEFGKIDKDVLRITGEAIGVELLTLPKPAAEEGLD